MYTPETLFKSTGYNGSAIFGKGLWPLPENDQPGAWRWVMDELQLCHYGLHYSNGEHVLAWPGPELYTFEPHPEATVITDDFAQDDQVGSLYATNRGRLLAFVPTWNERIARLLSCDVVASVTHFYNYVFAEDDRADRLVRESRAYAQTYGTASPVVYEQALDLRRECYFLYGKIERGEMVNLPVAARATILHRYRQAIQVTTLIMMLSDTDIETQDWWHLPLECIDLAFMLGYGERTEQFSRIAAYRRYSDRLLAYLNGQVTE